MGDEENNVAVVNAEYDKFADGWHGDGCGSYYCFKVYKR